MGSFYEKELQKTDQKEFRIEKVIKKKGDKLYVKLKGYDNCFNSWVDKKRHTIKWVTTLQIIILEQIMLPYRL